MLPPQYNQSKKGSPMNTHNLVRLIIRDKQKILLAQATKKNGTKFFFLPGGHIEYNESMDKAAKRELGEEINIAPERVTGISLLGVFEHSWDDNGSPYHELSFICSCKIDDLSSDRTIDSAESHLSFEWVDIEQLPHVNFLPNQFAIELSKWLLKSEKNEALFFSTIN